MGRPGMLANQLLDLNSSININTGGGISIFNRLPPATKIPLLKTM